MAAGLCGGVPQQQRHLSVISMINDPKKFITFPSDLIIIYYLVSST